ncbi:MAG: glycoside hydrolase family 5 protein [Defluviitaleaceae bacterium]|nr:glycoside hydrolase family 5 protein [Defluviitaleaceae bacterium]
MKKILIFVVTAVFFATLAACAAGNQQEDIDTEEDQAMEEQMEEQTADSNVDIALRAINQPSAEVVQSAAEDLVPFTPPENIYPRRIRIEDGYFVVGEDSRRIWFNGVNTPWITWNDFSGDNFDYDEWDTHFAELRANGINSTRVWINCSNNYGRSNEHGHAPTIFIDENGMIYGVQEQHWQNLDGLFEIAERHGIYIMATLLSFDHFQYNEWHNADPYRWRQMLQSEEAIISFVEHYTIPFVERFRDNPFLWSIDLMNEPDWVHENAAAGRLAWEDISHFFARNTAAIRQNSEILVTVGLAMNKYNSDEDEAAFEGNKVSDEFMQNLYDNPYAALDFWSPHYYDWMLQWFGHPFTSTPYGRLRDGGWGLCPSRPAVLAETSGFGTDGFTLTEDYLNAMDNGWQGVLAWTSSGVDDHGTLEVIAPTTRYIAANFTDLVFPPGP